MQLKEAPKKQQQIVLLYGDDVKGNRKHKMGNAIVTSTSEGIWLANGMECLQKWRSREY